MFFLPTFIKCLNLEILVLLGVKMQYDWSWVWLYLWLFLLEWITQSRLMMFNCYANFHNYLYFGEMIDGLPIFTYRISSGVVCSNKLHSTWSFYILTNTNPYILTHELSSKLHWTHRPFLSRVKSRNILFAHPKIILNLTPVFNCLKLLD